MTAELIREETSTVGPGRESLTEPTDQLSREGLGALSSPSLTLALSFLLLLAIDNGGKKIKKEQRVEEVKERRKHNLKDKRCPRNHNDTRKKGIPKPLKLLTLAEQLLVAGE